jgi:hypothetical protein
MPDGDIDVEISQSESESAASQPQGTDESQRLGDVSLQPPEPLVQPMVRLMQQWAAPWGGAFMRPEGQRNIAGRVTGNDSWAGNGCYPTCVAMILRWWTVENPETAGLLDYPFPGGEPQDPPTACRRLFDSPFVPSRAQAVPAEKQDRLRQLGYDDPTVDRIVDGDAMQNAVRAVRRNDIPGPVAFPITFLRVQMPVDLGLRQLTLKFWLQFGPVIALLPNPGHFVVVDGYRAGTIYICDPGNVLVNLRYCRTPPRLRGESERPAGEPQSGGYVAIDDAQPFQMATGAAAPWPMLVSSLDVAFLDPLNVHPQWSDLSQGR